MLIGVGFTAAWLLWLIYYIGLVYRRVRNQLLSNKYYLLVIVQTDNNYTQKSTLQRACPAASSVWAASTGLDLLIITVKILFKFKMNPQDEHKRKLSTINNFKTTGSSNNLHAAK